LELLAEDVLECLRVGSEGANALGELVRRHLVLRQLPSELRLVVDERDLGQLFSALGLLHAQLGLDLVGRVLQLLQQLGCDGQVVAASELLDFPDVGKTRP